MQQYTKDILSQRIHAYKILYESSKLNRLIRKPNFPEDVSENIVRMYIGDTCKWRDKCGDLWCSVSGKIEVKCFISDGPVSFGPKESWDQLYLVDARQFYLSQFTLYKINLSSIDDYWNNMPVNSKQTYRDQINQKRRPRVSAIKLLEYASEYTETIPYQAS